MSDSLEKTLANDLKELPPLTEAVRAHLEGKNLAPSVIHDVLLILEELVSNIVLWGYDDGREHLIRVKTEVDPGQIRIFIEDDGRKFDPTSIEQPDVLLAPQHRREGGLGVHIARSLADRISYRRAGGKNLLEVAVAAD